MATDTQSRFDYDHEAVGGAELDGVTTTEAANIAGELSLTTVTAVEARDDGRFKVELEVDGGFFGHSNAGSIYGIQAITGRGNPETVTLWVVEERM